MKRGIESNQGGDFAHAVRCLRKYTYLIINETHLLSLRVLHNETVSKTAGYDHEAEPHTVSKRAQPGDLP
jgi:hypothetical protein